MRQFFERQFAFKPVRIERLATLVVLLLALLAGACGRADAEERRIALPGGARNYILHVPAHAPEGPKPLVIALHGALQPASVLQTYLDLDAIADLEGFIVAYPKGINLLWNDGRRSVAGFMPIIDARDDAGFVMAVRDQLVAEGLADAGRAYLMGFSNGGFLTAFVACRHADAFAAYATMMMTVPVEYSESCRPSRPVPILMMNGTYDPIVPMFGRQTPGARLMSASESVELFARLDGCAAPQVGSAPNTRIWRFDTCAGGAAVAYYEIAGGHQPPSQSTDMGDALAALVLGPRRSGIDAPQEIWTFFRRFGTPAPALAAESAPEPQSPRRAAAASAPPADSDTRAAWAGIADALPEAAPVQPRIAAGGAPTAPIPRPVASPLRARAGTVTSASAN